MLSKITPPSTKVFLLVHWSSIGLIYHVFHRRKKGVVAYDYSDELNKTLNWPPASNIGQQLCRYLARKYTPTRRTKELSDVS